MRTKPGWQIVALLKRARIRQHDIAANLGITNPVVNRVIHRIGGVSPETTERVWSELDRVLQKSGGSWIISKTP